MQRPGVVYVLINPSMTGLVKIGRTEGSAADRARELSRATGVPTPFVVAFEAPFPDSAAAEAFVHTRLGQRGCRVSDGREFFEVSPTDAIRAVMDAEAVLGGAGSSNSASDEARLIPAGAVATGECDAELEEADMDSPFYATFEAAEVANYGHGDALQDRAEALRLYRQAANLGSISAWRQMGDLYSFEPELTDNSKALECYRHGANRGDVQCYAGMARAFVKRGQLENAGKCWDRYFASQHFKARRSGVGNCVYEYVSQVRHYGLPFTHRDAIKAPQIMNTLRLRDKDLSWLDRL